jgi:hypothetical protein
VASEYGEYSLVCEYKKYYKEHTPILKAIEQGQLLIVKELLSFYIKYGGTYDGLLETSIREKQYHIIEYLASIDIVYTTNSKCFHFGSIDYKEYTAALIQTGCMSIDDLMKESHVQKEHVLEAVFRYIQHRESNPNSKKCIALRNQMESKNTGYKQDMSLMNYYALMWIKYHTSTIRNSIDNIKLLDIIIAHGATNLVQLIEVFLTSVNERWEAGYDKPDYSAVLCHLINKNTSHWDHLFRVYCSYSWLYKSHFLEYGDLIYKKCQENNMMVDLRKVFVSLGHLNIQVLS